MSRTLPITIAIPTYRREAVLIDTLQYLLPLASVVDEILVLDQTEVHEAATVAALQEMADHGQIRWLKLGEPSIPQAMNRGLIEASKEIVLFLDDDIRPDPELLLAHLSAHGAHADSLVAGRVVQPWQEGQDFSCEQQFHFASTFGRNVDEFIGCNFSVGRSTALALGGFDENFVKVAYRFEAEFAHRFRASGRSIWFEPSACLHHLKAESGGTRTFGDFLRTVRPDHAVGAYYFALRTSSGGARLKTMLKRIVTSVATRHHLKRPWWIPVTLIGETRALVWALMLSIHGPRLVVQSQVMTNDE